MYASPSACVCMCLGNPPEFTAKQRRSPLTLLIIHTRAPTASVYLATAAWALKLARSHTVSKRPWRHRRCRTTHSEEAPSCCAHTPQSHRVASACLGRVVFPLSSLPPWLNDSTCPSPWRPGDLAPVQGKLLQHVPSHADRAPGPLSGRAGSPSATLGAHDPLHAAVQHHRVQPGRVREGAHGMEAGSGPPTPSDCQARMSCCVGCVSAVGSQRSVCWLYVCGAHWSQLNRAVTCVGDPRKGVASGCAGNAGISILSCAGDRNAQLQLPAS